MAVDHYENFPVASLLLPRALRAGAAVAGAGAEAVRAAARSELAGADVELDYLALVDPATFAEVRPGHRGRAILAVAGVVGSTRLIDNLEVDLGEEE